MNEPRTRRLLRVSTLSEQLGISRTTLWRMVKDGTFPAPRRITAGVKGWLPKDVDEWLERQEAA